ncbi:MAG: diacylglycerol kinase family protein [Bacteroidota bacterium]
MKRTLLFLINPIAGTRSKQSLEVYLKCKAEAAELPYTILHSTPKMDAHFLLHAAEEANATDVIVCGGDGTVNMAAKAFQNTKTNIGIIPVGSGNGLARCAGIPLKPRNAFDVILNGKVQATDAFKVNDHFSCMLSGLGLDAAVAASFAKQTTRGLYTYTTQTLIQFFKANPYHFNIELPGLCFHSDAFFISIANSNQFGNNVTIAPMASLHDGLLDIVIVQKMVKAGIPLAVMKQLRGNNKLHTVADAVGKQNVIYLQTPSLKIVNKQLAPLHIDGDPCETVKEIEIKILPGAFRLLVP